MPKFIVEITREDLRAAGAADYNSKELAEVIERELRATCGLYEPTDVGYELLRNVTVKPSRTYPDKTEQ